MEEEVEEEEEEEDESRQILEDDVEWEGDNDAPFDPNDPNVSAYCEAARFEVSGLGVPVLDYCIHADKLVVRDHYDSPRKQDDNGEYNAITSVMIERHQFWIKVTKDADDDTVEKLEKQRLDDIKKRNKRGVSREKITAYRYRAWTRAKAVLKDSGWSPDNFLVDCIKKKGSARQPYMMWIAQELGVDFNSLFRGITIEDEPPSVQGK